jgi:IclR family pca regulon transcriptional regulator
VSCSLCEDAFVERIDDGDRYVPEAPPTEFVAALARGLDVLEAFAADAPTMTLSEVAAKTAMSPATARRSLMTLAHLGYVQQVGRHFRLTTKVLSLGGTYFGAMSVAGLARPILHDLAASIDHPCSLTVLEGNDVVYLAHVMSSGGPSFRRHFVGARLPAHATSTGHVLLAALDPARRRAYLRQAPFIAYTSKTPTTAAELIAVLDRTNEQGYAVVRDTVEYGAAAVAVPVRDSAGVVVAAINSSASAVRERDVDAVLERLDVMRAAASTLERAIVRFPGSERSA